MTTIAIDSLTKRHGRRTAVDALSFRVAPGRITGFLGPNGAGKTTTLRALLGLVSPDAGCARIHGLRYADLTEPARVVGAALGGGGAHPGRRGRDHLRALARAARLPAAQVESVLEQVGLTDAGRRRVGAYSLGMRQRLGLAVALLGDPEVLVLDEPANGLDPQGARWLRALLRERADRGGTVLVASHALAELALTIDDVVVVDRGRSVAQAPLHELLDRHDGASLEEAFLALTTGAP